MTGAGISAASGIPTFRGEQGLWRNRRAEELATPQAFARDPNLVWEFYRWRRRLVAAADPNPGHQTLVEVERCRSPFAIITQNIDGLHQKAGSRNVIELHGSLWRTRCTSCGHRWPDRSFAGADLPTCPECSSLGRPDVVWFGENLPADDVQLAMDWSRAADLMLVIGTSAIVQPAGRIPLMAQEAGAVIIEFNLERTPLSDHAQQVVLGPCAETVPAWWHGTRGQIRG